MASRGLTAPQPSGPGMVGHLHLWQAEVVTMEIQFRHDVDNVLAEAGQQKKPVLLDFSAAPM